MKQITCTHKIAVRIRSSGVLDRVQVEFKRVRAAAVKLDIP